MCIVPSSNKIIIFLTNKALIGYRYGNSIAEVTIGNFTKSLHNQIHDHQSWEYNNKVVKASVLEWAEKSGEFYI